MQQIYLPNSVYKLHHYSRPQETLQRLENRYGIPVRKWEKLRQEGVSEATASEFTGISRATYYRYRKILQRLKRGIVPRSKRPKCLRKSQIPKETKELILKIRRENPTYGKAKIAVIIKRDYGVQLSESSVGRILKDFMQRGLVQTSASAPKAKKKRRFNKYAKQWSYTMKAQKPGQMVQVDHMSVHKNQMKIKHFQAWDPISKTICAEIYSNAKSSTAKLFLAKMLADMPFKVTSIQVDGGSEFMKEFEEECQKLGIDLFVLPPKRPQYNGGVERGNRTFREEFYNRKALQADSLGELRINLKNAILKYNTYRPHFNLNGLTPYDYYNANFQEAA